MLTLSFDLADFRRRARQMGILADDQLPYAIAKTLNDTMFSDVRPHVIGPLWRRSFRVRHSGFARAAINVEKASKGSLQAGVFDRLKRGHLGEHADGGTKVARGNLAVPNQTYIRLSARGKSPKPRTLDTKIKKRALRVIKGKGIFVGVDGELRPYFWFRRSARLKARFGFAADFQRVATDGINTRFPTNMQHAFNTAFR